MGNVIQRLTHRGGEFRLTQVNEATSSGKPTITVTEDQTNTSQDDDLEPNGGDCDFATGYYIVLKLNYRLKYHVKFFRKVNWLSFFISSYRLCIYKEKKCIC